MPHFTDGKLDLERWDPSSSMTVLGLQVGPSPEPAHSATPSGHFLGLSWALPAQKLGHLFHRTICKTPAHLLRFESPLFSNPSEQL